MRELQMVPQLSACLLRAGPRHALDRGKARPRHAEMECADDHPTTASRTPLLVARSSGRTIYHLHSTDCTDSFPQPAYALSVSDMIHRRNARRVRTSGHNYPPCPACNTSLSTTGSAFLGTFFPAQSTT